MTNTSPIFPIHEPQHFSDYGFDPQFDYFQVLDEARTHKRESSSFRSIIDFKFQKPISKDDNSKKIKKSRKRWWKNALHFFKRKRTSSSDKNSYPTSFNSLHCVYGGPVYLAESRSGFSTPYNRSGAITPTRKGDLNIPYMSLNELNMDQAHKISASHMPIYLVT